MKRDEMISFILEHEDAYTENILNGFSDNHLETICNRINAEIKLNIKPSQNGRRKE